VKFTPYNALPPDATIRLTYPSQISVSSSIVNTNCYVITNSVRSSVCTVQTSLIIYKGAFSNLGYDWNNEVTVAFMATNPEDNTG